MKKRKLLLLPAFSLLSLPVVAVACSTNEVQRREIVSLINSARILKAFDYDSTASYGGAIDQNGSGIVNLTLGRQQALNSAQTEVVEIDGKPEVKVVKPVFLKHKLELATAVVVTTKDDQVKVFDNDEAEVTPEPTETLNGKQYYSSLNVELSSNNEKSINSLAFQTALQNAKKVQLVIREGVKWVDSQGNDTGYTVKTKDILYSWWRTKAIDTDFRHEHGGSLYLDRLTRKTLLEKTSIYFTDQVRYPNEYLFELYGIDSSKFNNPNDFITKLTADSLPESIKNKEAISFEAVGGGNSSDSYNFKELYDKMFEKDLTFVAAPSDYIEEQNAKIVKLTEDYWKQVSDADAKKAEIAQATTVVTEKTTVYENAAADLAASKNKKKQAQEDKKSIEKIAEAQRTDEQKATLNKANEILQTVDSEIQANETKTNAAAEEKNVAEKRLSDLTVSILNYFKAHIKDSKLDFVYNYLGDAPEDAAQFYYALSTLDKDSIAFKSGIYWYGVSVKNNLFNGYYYTTGLKNLRQQFFKNTHFYDEEFVNSTDNIVKITNDFQQPIDANIFRDRTFNLYKSGRLTQVPYSSLTDKQKLEVESNPSKFGLQYTQIKNTNTPHYSYLQNAYPVTTDNPEKYKFTDEYALINWGLTRTQLAAGQKPTDEYILGLGLSFRSILKAAINWNTVVSIQSNDLQQPWFAKVASDSKIGGSDQETAKYKTPLEANSEINKLYAIDVDGNKINFGTDSEPKYEISLEDNKQYASSKSDDNEKLKSVYFDKLKDEMKKVLDEFDRRYPDYAGHNIKVNLFYLFTNLDSKTQQRVENLARVARELNSRLDLELVYFTKAEGEWEEFTRSGLNGYVRTAWGYDYDSIGSGYDGLTTTSQLLPQLTQIYALKSSDETKYNKFKALFPQIAKLADGLLEYEKTHKFIKEGSDTELSLEKLYLVDPNFLNNRFGYVNQVKFVLDSTTNRYKLYRNPDTQRVQFLNDNPDTSLWSASFWYDYVSKQKNEDLVQLMKEFSTYLDYDYVNESNKTIESYRPILVNKNYLYPVVLGSDFDNYADWKVVVEEKTNK
ncbi:OppA family ABC transporter substrate-binding lipoprotein [Mycoplasmopsis columbina]|uniref:OppA family ABC transporter substrate-binding lipoprotein n=1 Tax=Mycoplasmopsis columbina TaxID=114881 RepID=UPI0004A77C59|nr:hypothetical protein [Mycoplasmopsis columbina]VEU76975.1 Uncharacterised protein [Mycoplasmopsis columbina]